MRTVRIATPERPRGARTPSAPPDGAARDGAGRSQPAHAPPVPAAVRVHREAGDGAGGNDGRAARGHVRDGHARVTANRSPRGRDAPRADVAGRILGAHHEQVRAGRCRGAARHAAVPASPRLAARDVARAPRCAGAEVGAGDEQPARRVGRRNAPSRCCRRPRRQARSSPANGLDDGPGRHGVEEQPARRRHRAALVAQPDAQVVLAVRRDTARRVVPVPAKAVAPPAASGTSSASVSTLSPSRVTIETVTSSERRSRNANSADVEAPVPVRREVRRT